MYMLRHSILDTLYYCINHVVTLDGFASVTMTANDRACDAIYFHKLAAKITAKRTGRSLLSIEVLSLRNNKRKDGDGGERAEVSRYNVAYHTRQLLLHVVQAHTFVRLVKSSQNSPAPFSVLSIRN